MSRRTLGVVAVVVLVGVGCLAAASGGKSGVPCADEFAAHADAITIWDIQAKYGRRAPGIDIHIHDYLSLSGDAAKECIEALEAQSGP